MYKKIAIVHFQPIEKYPPIINLLNCLSSVSVKDKTQIYIYTQFSSDQNWSYAPTYHEMHVVRQTSINHHSDKLKRMFGYFRFYFATFYQLLKRKPEKVLVYENLSILPVWLWSFFKQKKSEIYIHYHEYTSPEEYKTGTFIMKMNYLIEKKLVQKAIWVSHTNDKRMEKFRKDFHLQKGDSFRILANYPPVSWASAAGRKNEADKDFERIGIVYVGALSLETMYVKEFAEWISKYPDMFYWDIYTQQPTGEIYSFLQQTKIENISVKGFVEYKDLPLILAKYDVGVILYKGHIPNYVYNAPNKLFEYLTKELDVWYPEEMEGIHQYKTTDQYPQVISLNFKNLQKLKPEKLLRNKALTYIPFNRYAEKEYAEIIERLIF